METRVDVVERLMTADECALLVRECGAVVAPSGLLGAKIDGYRTSSSTHVLFRDEHSPEVDALIKRLSARVSEITGLPRENQEDPQLARYRVGEQYKPHHDFFFPKTEYYARTMARGGQRVWTVLIYLQAPDRGGHTEFTKLGQNLMPGVGSALVWRNVRADGVLDMDTLHAGRPVEEGEKWIMTFWVRERKFV